MTDPVLGVFAKQPIAGRAKTRLAADRSPAWACRAAHAFLADTLDRLDAVSARRYVVYAPADAGPFFVPLARGQYDLLPQADGDLGDRLRAFFRQAQADGAERTVAVGADSPTLPVAYVEQAFALLERADVVLGPACDGGYYLIGVGRRLPPVFDDIAWSSADVLRQTVERLADAPWRLALLPPWYDVDTPADWALLRGHVLALRRAGQDPGVPHTAALMDKPDDV